MAHRFLASSSTAGVLEPQPILDSYRLMRWTERKTGNEWDLDSKEILLCDLTEMRKEDNPAALPPATRAPVDDAKT
jgi:hypothetical protein